MKEKLIQIRDLAQELLTEEPAAPQPAPAPPQRITGDIPFDYTYCACTDDSSRQDFASFFTGPDFAAAWHSDYDRKPFAPVNFSYFQFRPEMQVMIERIELGDGTGTNDTGVNFGAYLRADPIRYVKNVIPAFKGKKWNGWHRHAVAPGHQQMDTFVMEAPMDKSRNLAGSVPTKIKFFGSYIPYTPQAYEHRPVPVEKALGAVAYMWNFDQGAHRGIDPAKMEIAKAAHLYRLFLDPDMLYDANTQTYGFEPTITGGWRLDGILRAHAALGNEVILCPQGIEGRADLPELCRQLAIRYGSNAKVPADQIRTSPAALNSWQGEEAKNKPLAGLGLIRKIQIGNEPDHWWKGRTDVANQKNIGGFLSPSEYAVVMAECYKAIKAVDPAIEVIIGGLATTRPGYVLAMNRALKLLGAKGYDAVAYHDYCNAKGGQQAGATYALPPELSGYEENARIMLQAAWEHDPAVKMYVTESGYSISTVNPEQAVQASGAFTLLEMQAIYTIRLAFASLRAGLSGLTVYQLYDDKACYTSDPAQPVAWDTSCGIAHRDKTDRHDFRPATYFMWQVRTLLQGYTLAETTKGDVYKDRFVRAGEPDIYACYVPEKTDIRRPFKLMEGEGKDVVMYTLRPDATLPDQKLLPVEHGKEFEATVKPTFFIIE